jgi:hypothetical protein
MKHRDFPGAHYQPAGGVCHAQIGTPRPGDVFPPIKTLSRSKSRAIEAIEQTGESPRTFAALCLSLISARLLTRAQPGLP